MSKRMRTRERERERERKKEREREKERRRQREWDGQENHKKAGKFGLWEAKKGSKGKKKISLDDNAGWKPGM